jgi:hypothetical protein
VTAKKDLKGKTDSKEIKPAKSLFAQKLKLRMTRLIQRKFVDEIAEELTPLVTRF